MAACAWFGGSLQAAPEPAAAPADWQLSIAFDDPQRISVTLPGDSEPTTYWYLLYTVTNNSGQDVDYYPSFDLVTNQLQVVEGGAGIHPLVYDAIAQRHKKDHPFFAPPAKVLGPLLQGEDNARTSAAVFRGFDPSADAFKVYVGGLSGEVVRVRNPSFDPSKPESEKNARAFVLRKTLALEYQLPGEAATRPNAVPARVNREWVMR